MKYIGIFLKQLVLGFIILYGYNIVAVNFNLVLPINVITLSSVSILGFPGLFALILFYVYVY